MGGWGGSSGVAHWRGWCVCVPQTGTLRRELLAARARASNWNQSDVLAPVWWAPTQRRPVCVTHSHTAVPSAEPSARSTCGERARGRQRERGWGGGVGAPSAPCNGRAVARKKGAGQASACGGGLSVDRLPPFTHVLGRLLFYSIQAPA